MNGTGSAPTQALLVDWGVAVRSDGQNFRKRLAAREGCKTGVLSSPRKANGTGVSEVGSC